MARFLHSVLLCFSVGLLSVIYLAMFPVIDAAAFSDGRFMTSQEALSLFGSEISAKYFDGTGYTDITFYYQTTWANGFNNYGSVESEDSSLSMYKNQPYLVYTASATGVNYSNSYVTVDIRPEYSIFDTSQIHSCIALSCGDASQYVSSAAYNSPSWDWYWNGSRVHTENSALSSSGSGTYAVLKNVFTANSISSFTFVPINLSFSAKSSGYSVQASFWGNRTFYNKYCLCIMLPYVDTDSSGSNGTFATTTASSGGSGGGDINVNVDVDMEETNGILSRIKESIDSLVQRIIDGLKGLFIPSDDFMDDFKADMEQLLQGHLGGLYEAEELIVNSFDDLPNVVAKSEIYIPAVNLSLGGENLTLGNWHIPLKVSGLPAILYDGIAFIIDFLCIAAFLRMCRNKLEIFLNPDSEVIQQ